MQQQQQRSHSHVPKFGNWDGDNVPYTAYFENARKEKGGGIRFNPNDPQQNPEAFNTINGNAVSPSTPDNEVPLPIPPPRFGNHQKQRTLSSESTSNEKSPVSYHHRNKSTTDTPNPNPPINYNAADDFSYRSVSVPKFGQWDENDPKSGDGFTVIFNKVKEEKQIAAAKFPSVPIKTTNNYQANASQEKETRKSDGGGRSKGGKVGSDGDRKFGKENLKGDSNGDGPKGHRVNSRAAKDQSKLALRDGKKFGVADVSEVSPCLGTLLNVQALQIVEADHEKCSLKSDIADFEMEDDGEFQKRDRAFNDVSEDDRRAGDVRFEAEEHVGAVVDEKNGVKHYFNNESGRRDDCGSDVFMESRESGAGFADRYMMGSDFRKSAEVGDVNLMENSNSEDDFNEEELQREKADDQRLSETEFNRYIMADMSSEESNVQQHISRNNNLQNLEKLTSDSGFTGRKSDQNLSGNGQATLESDEVFNRGLGRSNSLDAVKASKFIHPHHAASAMERDNGDLHEKGHGMIYADKSGQPALSTPHPCAGVMAPLLDSQLNPNSSNPSYLHAAVMVPSQNPSSHSSLSLITPTSLIHDPGTSHKNYYLQPNSPLTHSESGANNSKVESDTLKQPDDVVMNESIPNAWVSQKFATSNSHLERNGSSNVVLEGRQDGGNGDSDEMNFLNALQAPSAQNGPVVFNTASIKDIGSIDNSEGANELPLWYVHGCPMRVFKWTPGFNPAFETSNFALWITLPGLPLHLFDHNALYKIGSVFGRPIQIEHATANQSRVSFAKICVEIDLTKSYPEKFLLNLDGHGIMQRVIFDKMPLYCSVCCHIGHAKETCYVFGNGKNSGRAGVQSNGSAGSSRVHAKDNVVRSRYIASETEEWQVVDLSKYNHVHGAANRSGVVAMNKYSVLASADDLQEKALTQEKEIMQHASSSLAGKNNSVIHKADFTKSPKKHAASDKVVHGVEMSGFKRGGRSRSPSQRIAEDERARSCARVVTDSTSPSCPMQRHESASMEVDAQVTASMNEPHSVDGSSPMHMFLSLVYGRHSREVRFELWQQLRDIDVAINGRPWLVGGDFNIFFTDDEVENGTSDRHREMMDFGDAISDCQLIDLSCDGAWFTWERPSTGLRERLDRILLGELWTSVFAVTRVTHQSRNTPDHTVGVFFELNHRRIIWLFINPCSCKS
ncbi:hypothetical protein C2S51_008573 [Perilla frutescens var. frutescens]|nr:hypothetical protein C2S51_008573 [Perilla frutescens var. frutescens]